MGDLEGSKLRDSPMPNLRFSISRSAPTGRALRVLAPRFVRGAKSEGRQNSSVFKILKRIHCRIKRDPHKILSRFLSQEDRPRQGAPDRTHRI